MRKLMLASVCVLMGCATIASSMGILGPGVGVTPQIATAFCGSEQAFSEKLAAAKTAAKGGTPVRARVGMTACEVLALIGKPHEQTTVETAGSGGVIAHWTYWEASTRRSGKEPRLVVLERGPDGRGVVQSVVW
jgi:hypothetical protein